MHCIAGVHCGCPNEGGNEGPNEGGNEGGGAVGVTELDGEELSDLTPYGVSSSTVNV